MSYQDRDTELGSVMSHEFNLIPRKIKIRAPSAMCFNYKDPSFFMKKLILIKSKIFDLLGEAAMIQSVLPRHGKLIPSEDKFLPPSVTLPLWRLFLLKLIFPAISKLVHSSVMNTRFHIPVSCTF